MNDIVIRTEHLSKKYKIGTRSRSYKTLRDTLSSIALSPIRALSGLGSNVNRKDGKHDDFIWALKDISFEVKRGDVVGIIGRNGAGKSTLLKILSRITEPTSGFADISGRVGSLLEVGTGFHPELTGRENIYLNGAILGMRKSELDRKFDEIVAFAAVETFIDTPVKHYSSGMFLRLAFAVAAHLEPQILLVDEVLAVGDAMFQKKCLGKMGEVAKEGRTVLFVSHNMGAMRSLCNKAIVLENSRVIHDGEVSKGIES
jgi:lipopolysaccharide transport system ATP-binding protein